MRIVQLNRRDFLKSSILAGGGLVLGLSGFAKLTKAGADSSLPPYLYIAPDGGIHLGVPSAEMGQGIHTTLAMLLAEELEVEMSQIHHIETLHHPDFKHPTFREWTNSAINFQITGGSVSIRAWHLPFRKLGATARELLQAAAARKWDLPVAECRARNGRIEHSGTGRSLGYGELSVSASRLNPPENPPLKSPEQFRLLGRAIPRWDTRGKVKGTAVFGTDVDLPGMLYGTVKHCVVFGEKLTGVDDTKAKAVPGVIAIIPLEDQAVVVADSTWAAMQGAKELTLHTSGGHKDLSDENIIQQSRSDLAKTGVPVAHRGDPATAMVKAIRVMELEYESPMQAHAAMEPLCATASVTPEGCEVWAPTQSSDFAMMMAMGVTELSPEKIKVHTTYLGGGFGRKVEYDFITAPLVASKVLGKPVKITWTREEDTRHDFYRPPFLIHMQFGLDVHGIPLGLITKLVGPAVSRRWQMPPPWLEENGYDWVVTIGMFDGYNLPNRTPDLSKAYAIPNLQVDFVPSDIKVPTGAWRSIGTSHNTFALESALDEVAHAGGHDPFELRKKLLAHNPRALAVLDRSAELSGWGKPPEGRFHGMSYTDYLETYQVQVVEVSVSKRGKIKVHKITCVVDCGQVFNSHIAKQQLEGGILFGLTAALKGEINVQKGQIVQSNYDDYPMLKLKDTPEIIVHIIENHEPPGGLGEAGTPLIGPAVANAVFAATGKRVRRLPIKRNDLV
ncbi:MAG: xanthine dehydrogenase family protein molybdopterin-binding subunit [Opitutae bacterium]|nr:xanthine dehydrogenase family protein molybdopterin-binding subunit [Opitutae bacterium]